MDIADYAKNEANSQLQVP